ncbi:hypothetical protein ABFT80_06140 [Mesorhizobium sp. SB112]|uniref:hypothetical protein n=1 Tax=Mesorhizobium sp. SB112 TaxID=3151853 RepID=UPI003267F954
MMHILRHFYMSAGTPDAHRVAYERAASFHSFWFIIIESAIILGALSAAADALSSATLWTVYAVSYIALGLYILTAVQFALSLVAERFDWNTGAIHTRIRTAIGWIVGMSIPYVLSPLVAELIRAGITSP